MSGKLQRKVMLSVFALSGFAKSPSFDPRRATVLQADLDHLAAWLAFGPYLVAPLSAKNERRMFKSVLPA
jgi:hypothetical protein